MCFLHPSPIKVLKAFDVVRVVRLHAPKHDKGAIPPLDLAIKNVKSALKAKSADLVYEQLFHRILNRVLHLANANRTYWP